MVTTAGKKTYANLLKAALANIKKYGETCTWNRNIEKALPVTAEPWNQDTAKEDKTFL